MNQNLYLRHHHDLFLKSAELHLKLCTIIAYFSLLRLKTGLFVSEKDFQPHHL